jgi:hypothetical protein
VSFNAITLCVASQRVFIVVVYFVIDSVRKLLEHPRVCVCLYSAHRVCLMFRSVIFLGTLYVTELNKKENKISQDFLQLHSTYAVVIEMTFLLAPDNFCSCVSSSCLNSVS